jgi:hypothetical protein
MNYEQFENELKAKHPDLFDGHDIGLWVGEGWHPIIFSLCRQIDAYVKFVNNNPERTPVKVTVSQIKEKFGGLRFYYDGGDQYISGMVQMAEIWADHACEVCGDPGKQRSGGWIKTLCDKHDEERKAEYAKRFGDSAV